MDTRVGSSESHIQRKSLNEDETDDIENIVELLNRVDIDVACSSEKLANIHALIMHLLAWDNYEVIFPMSFEKALEFDIISGIINSEVKEVERSMENFETKVVVSRDNVSSCRNISPSLFDAKEKLLYLENSFNKCQDQMSDVKLQSMKLERTFSEFRINMWNSQLAMYFALNDQVTAGQMTLKRLAAEHQLQALRLLENSLSRELELEKKLSEVKRNEHQLNVKLQRMEQVTFRMEETAEVVWGRFLEAENKAEVFSGISKELYDHFQIAQFNISSSIQRESKLASQLQEHIHMKEERDAAMKNLERNIKELVSKSSQVPILMEKVALLEEQLKKYEGHIISTNALNAECREQLVAMENLVDSLKENLDESEHRAEIAEGKVTELTATSVELTEELNDVKSSRDDYVRKTSLIEKQVIELEIQLQHSKAAAEASQEQQNMLYSAIWDMETLIEDLKSKLSQADIKSEAAEEHCKRLSDANLELHGEISLLKSKVSMSEASFLQAEKLKNSYATEIKLKTQLLMDAVTQLTKQREFIQTQMYSPTRKNRLMMNKFIGIENDSSLPAMDD